MKSEKHIGEQERLDIQTQENREQTGNQGQSQQAGNLLQLEETQKNQKSEVEK